MKYYINVINYNKKCEFISVFEKYKKFKQENVKYLMTHNKDAF